MILRRISGPSAEPITLAEARAHCRITQSTLDAQIGLAISTARAECENATGRAIGAQRWAAVMDDFPRCHDLGVRLPAPPVLSVLSVTYTDPDGAARTIDPATLQLDQDSEPAVLFPAWNTSWPTTRCQPNAARVLVDCGYTDQTLPAQLKRWMLARVSFWVENPGATSEQAQAALPYLDGLLDGLRIMRMDT